MSLSSLQAQLAALNSNSRGSGNAAATAAGLSFASNRRHVESVGRGLTHSVQHGHSLTAASTKFKASLIYPTAAVAADVPLHTLQVQYQEAIQLLLVEIRHPSAPILQDLATTLLTEADQNDALNQNYRDAKGSAVKQTLTIVGSMLTECDDSIQDPVYQASLDILEYLLRRYEIHVAHKIDLLWALLPVAEKFPSIVHRSWMLCDWTNDSQSYLWLRPYCVEPKDTAVSSIVLPSRHALAVNVMKHTDILRTVCSVTRNMAALHNQEIAAAVTHNVYDDSDLDSDSRAGRYPRQGIAQVLSFTAALLVEGLSWMVVASSLDDSDKETILRTLLPTLMAAIDASNHHNNPDWTAWGYVVVSVVAETMELAPTLVELLCTKILRSRHSAVDDDEDDRNEADADALTCVLSIILPCRKLNSINSIEESSYLPLLNDKLLGCPLPKGVFEAMVVPHRNQNSFPAVLGHLYTNRNTIVAPFIGALLRKAIACLITNTTAAEPTPAGGSAKMTKRIATRTSAAAVDLIVGLIQDGGLQGVWKDPRTDLVASLAALMVKHCGATTHTIPHGRTVLAALHQHDAVATERGVAWALEKQQPQSQDQRQSQSDGMDVDGFENYTPPTADRIAEMIDGIILMNDDVNGKQTNAMERLLPPRLALEHANATIRLQAIQRLVEKCTEDDDVVVVNFIKDHDSSLLESLLRRMVDPDVQVATAACEALSTWFERGVVQVTKESVASRTAQLSLTACYKYYASNSDGARLAACLVVLAHLARDVFRLGGGDIAQPDRMEVWQRCVEVLGALLEHADVAEQAAVFLRIAMDRTEGRLQSKKVNSSDIVAAKKLLMESGSLLGGLQRLYSKTTFKGGAMEQAAESNFRRKCVFVVLGAMTETLNVDGASTTTGKNLANEALALCSVVVTESGNELSSQSAEFTKHQSAIVKKCLQNSLAFLPKTSEQVPKILLTLASTASNRSWTTIVDPAVKTLFQNARDGQERPVSAFTVLFEAALRHKDEVGSVVVTRLLSEARQLASAEGCVAPWLAVVPALSLLESSDQEVRVAAANLLSDLEPLFSQNSEVSKACANEWSCLQQVCQRISYSKASVTMGGDSFLSSFLATCIGESSNAPVLQEALLLLCVFAAVSCGSDSAATAVDAIENSWLSLEDVNGGCSAASTLLNAMELAGEEAFPLLARWKFAGSFLLESILAMKTNKSERLSLDLAKCVSRMLKGVTITDPSLIISSGPRIGSGGRARSYSIGKMEGVTAVTKYPDEMTQAVIRVLSKSEENEGAKRLATVITREVLKSKAWGEFVFRKLSRSARNDLANSILNYLGGDAAQDTDGLFSDLPLSTTDIIDLMKSCDRDEGLKNESILVDCILLHADTLYGGSDVIALVSLLFNRLSFHATSSSCDKDGTDFVIQSILLALGKILELTNHTLKVVDKTLDSWTKVLLHLLGCGSTLEHTKMCTSRSRSAALSLLVTLCANFPERVVASLVPAALTAVMAPDGMRPTPRNASSTFFNVVPTYIKYAAAGGRTLTNLFDAFVASVSSLRQDDRERMYVELATVLAIDRSDELFLGDLDGDMDACVGALQAFYLANEAHQARGGPIDSDTIGFAVGMLDHCSESAQTNSLLLLLRYARELITEFQDESAEQKMKLKGLLPTPTEIGLQAAVGSSSVESVQGLRRALKSSDKRKTVRGAIQAILRAFSDGLVLKSIRNFMQKGNGVVARLSLRLWQDLLMVQSAAQIPIGSAYHDDEYAQFQESVLSLVNESREFLQGILPPHVFLASVSSLIQEGGTTEIRSRALRLVADRAVTLDASSPEASLFVDILPIVLETLKAEMIGRETGHDDLVLMQSALVSVEHIARALRVNKSSGLENRATLGFQYFDNALQCCSQILSECNVLVDQDGRSDSIRDLISTTALCSATLVRVVGASCLPVLPKLIKSLVALLSSTNSRVSTMPTSSDKQLAQCRVTQLSIMRALVAVVDTAPQFLPPHLPAILTGPVILSESLKTVEKETSIPVVESVELFCTCLSIHVAPRLLVPAASKALTQCTRPSELEVLLSILKFSTERASSASVGAQQHALLNSITKAFEYKGAWKERSSVVLAACDLFDTLVLKLSEVQLRRIYTSMREWRGDLNLTDPEQLATRRFAFWAVSPRLSKGLRTIFLPCLTSVLDDMVAEFDLAVHSLGRRGQTGKAIEGTKKRKLDDPAYGKESMRVLQPLLATLENSLRADAFQGGSWIREDDGQKYESLLKPLGKLLLSRIPAEFPVPDDVTDTYQYVVEGLDGGSVIGCLTSLAAAGGNEQLWKPLNHAILQACGDESRSEVRRAGVVCLLELMKSLGEEYMVLLPENLPLLAELLEDSNEDVASLAKEVVTLAEDLIGESLEDNLR